MVHDWLASLSLGISIAAPESWNLKNYSPVLQILPELIEKGGPAKKLIEAKGLLQVSVVIDASTLTVSCLSRLS